MRDILDDKKPLFLLFILGQTLDKKGREEGGDFEGSKISECQKYLGHNTYTEIFSQKLATC